MYLKVKTLIPHLRGLPKIMFFLWNLLLSTTKLTEKIKIRYSVEFL